MILLDGRGGGSREGRPVRVAFRGRKFPTFVLGALYPALHTSARFGAYSLGFDSSRPMFEILIGS